MRNYPCAKGGRRKGRFPVPGDTQSPTTLIGRYLGHYRILKKIGAGGMGEVYLAHDEHLDREVAVKVLHPGTILNESSRRHLRQEALTLSKLNYPSIATIYDFDSRDGVDFLAMEYVSGTTLSEKLAKGSLLEKEAVRLGTQLADGLEAAHEHGVIHRDLKPSNLRLTEDGRLKILDFGLAKLRQSVEDTITAEGKSETWAMAGTLPYMAPEQLLGGEIDARTDIHAFGTVMYEMVTGERPFADVPRSRLAGAILHQPTPPPSALNPKLSPELARIITKCLEKEPENRYQSAKELSIDLRRLERTPQTAPETFPERGVAVNKDARHSRRVRVLTGVAAIAILVVVGLLWNKYADRPSPGVAAASIAVLPFTDLSPNHDQEYFSDGLAEEILNDLAKIPNLKVVGRTSSFQFKGKNEDLRQIGQKLNASNVLEGSVRKNGDHVRVTAQLIKTSDGFHLWSDTYDRELKDILILQDDIAKAVTSTLQLKLAVEQARTSRQTVRVANPEAFQALLQARYFYRMHDQDSSRKTREYATRAIQLDPDYAPAYALRSESEMDAGAMLWADYPEAVAQARRDAEKAIALDPTSADGYRATAYIHDYADMNCREAETWLKKARELAPGDAVAVGRSAELAMCLGHLEEAATLFQKEFEIDPLQVSEYKILGEVLLDLGRYEEAYAALRKSLDLNPNEGMVHETWGEVLLAQGHPQEALIEMQKERQLEWYRDLGLALAYHALGKRKESDLALARIVAQYSNYAAYQIAQAYAYRGEVDEAFKWLDRAYSQRDPGLHWFMTDLKLKSLRSDPRYALMLKKLNLN